MSREVRVAPPELERWRRVFLDGGQQGLKGKNRAGGELMRTRAKLGEMTMRVELQTELLEKKGVRGRASEALEALGRVSPGTNRAYPLAMVCETWRVARSSVYALRARLGGPVESDRRRPGKRGPKTELSDEELAKEIRMVLSESPFLGEGHRKVKVRLGAKGIRVGKNRVLRLMRAHGLLAPVRQGHPRGDRSHSGRIRTERPDELWGTDASRFWTRGGGLVLVLRGRRPLRPRTSSAGTLRRRATAGRRWSRSARGVRAHMGGFGKAIALGLGLRHDWGSQYRAKQFQAEIRWLGIRSTARLCGRAGVQRRRRALRADAQGRVHPLARLRNPRGGQRSDRGLHRTLQQRLAPPAARVSDPGPRPPEAQPQGGLMFSPSPCPENRVRYTLQLRKPAE